MISSIVAVAKNWCIGNNNELPWKQKADLQYFRKTTKGSVVIMGRKTYESIGRPLPKRRNIIITRQQDYAAPGVEVFHSLEEAIAAAKNELNARPVFIIGGAQIYTESLSLVDRLYITFIETVVEGDAFFPEIDTNLWREVSREKHLADEDNQFAYDFVVFERSVPSKV